jgi:autotransporter-associated beta strand protein
MKDCRANYFAAWTAIAFAFWCFAGESASAATRAWSGGGPNDLWSTGGVGGNWGGAAAPVGGDAVNFTQADAQVNSTTINNIVDANLTLIWMRYAFTTTTNVWQNTQINPGVTLTLNGTDGARTFGLDSANAGNLVTQVTISGGGTLSVDRPAGGTIRIGEGTTGNTSGTLDMSGLGTFTANLGSSGLFQIGSLSSSVGTAGWLVKLADTSTITTGTLSVGGTTLSASLNILNLGSGTQTINANTINVGSAPTGGNRGSGEILFNTGSGTLKIRSAADPVNGRADLNVINASNATGGDLTGLFDVTGHDADLRLGTLRIGNRNLVASGSPGSTVGTFSFDTGTLDVTSINMGIRNNNNSANGVTAELNIGGGSATIGGISMAQNTGAIGSGTATATLNFTGGTITMGGNISQVTNSAQSIGTLNLDGATLDMGGFNIGGAIAVTNVNLKSGTLKNVGQINNGAAISKTTTGTLTLDGTNTHTGATNVTSGTFVLNGTHTPGGGAGTYTISSNANLLGTGETNGNLHALSGSTVAPGAPASSIESLGVGDMGFDNGSTFSYQIDSTSVSGDLLFGDTMSLGNATLALSDLGSSFVTVGSKFTLIAYDGPYDGGIFAGYLDDSIFSFAGGQWLINYNDVSPGMNFQNDAANNGNLFVTITAVPEPNTWNLMILATFAFAAYAWQQRRHAAGQE